MTNTNGPDDKDSSGKEKRPYTTLDLTADEVSSGKEEQRDEAARKTAYGSKEQLRLDKPAAGPSNDGGERWIGILTHAAAGAIGAALTLLVALWIFGNTEGGGNVPAVSSDEVETLRTAISDAEAKISTLESELRNAVEQAAAAPGQDRELASLSERLAALESRPAAATVTKQSVQQSIDPIATQMAEIESRLNALADAQQERRVDSKSMAVSLAFYNLQRAAREGRPYAR